MTRCLICENEIQPFLNFGKMPIANGFLSEDQFQKEPFFDLSVGLCETCLMVQLTERLDPDQMFHENYAYFSSISVRMSNHFREFAHYARDNYLSKEKPFVVEIGSNDGIMLKNFAEEKIPHLGVEPSANVAEVARSKGINTISSFFNEETAKSIRKEHGPADLVLGANVICHIPALNSVVKGVKHLLKDKGVFMFEEPYMGDIVQKTSYDQIYDEHIFYFSVHSLSWLVSQHGMEIIDVLPQDVHGGSMRTVVAHKGQHPVHPRVAAQIKLEESLGLKDPATYRKFADNVAASRDQLVGLLKDLRGKGKRVAGYGATSKSTTVMNFCGIGPEMVEYISDTTPTKLGKFSPGVHVPVVPYEKFKNDKVEYTVLFAWNHAGEILEKEKAWIQGGGHFIMYVPSVRIENTRS